MFAGDLTLLAGFMAVLMLASAVAMATHETHHRYGLIFRMLSAGGIAATLVFGLFLVLQLVHLVAQAFTAGM